MKTEIIGNGDSIRRTRILAGLTKKDVAAAAGIQQLTVARAEKGQGVSPKAAKQLCMVLGADFDTLFKISTPAQS